MDPASSGLPASIIKTHALRLHPDQDLKEELLKFARLRQLRAACVLTAVGSLQKLRLRFADSQAVTTTEGKFEIVSLVGTLTQDSVHLHMSASDASGKTWGGHLVAGNSVYTTAEVVIGELQDLTFLREEDPRTTFKELVVRPRKEAAPPPRKEAPVRPQEASPGTESLMN